MMNTRRAWLFLTAVFLLGAMLGSLGTYWLFQQGVLAEAEQRRHHRKGAVEWLNRELDLNPEQRQQLEAILDETGTAYKAIRERTRPEYEAVRHHGRQKIRAILTETQRSKFEELVRQIDEREARRRKERRLIREGQSSGSANK